MEKGELQLTFTYSARGYRGEFGPAVEYVVKPAGETAAHFPDDFEMRADSIARADEQVTLSFIAMELKSAASAYFQDGQALAEKVKFIDADSGKQKEVTPATFTPH
ncbi:MAG: hypothetical protein H6867_07295 [Rhodospirillales bacterium]|nr:hypothetical protein [Rhodospirillales bacterium]MCB9995356.1 hypothetical protein [Rhodospirillales bacterium]